MGSRGGEYEREALILSRALVPLWFLSGHPERNSPRRAKPCSQAFENASPQKINSPAASPSYNPPAPRGWSSLSQSETHLEIFEDVIKADAKMVANVVNDKLLPLMARHGFPVQGLSFQWDDAASFSPAERREEERLLLEYYEIDPQYFIDNYNIPITGVRQPKTQPDAFFE